MKDIYFHKGYDNKIYIYKGTKIIQIKEIKMTLDYIKQRIEEIEKSKGDDEEAHGMEDDLYFKFIKYISKLPKEESLKDLSKKAKHILKTKNINFGRYCS